MLDVAQQGAWVLAMVAVGLAAGFVSGLLGVAGIVVVPVLDMVFGLMAVPSPLRLKAAIATSLAIVASTSWAATKAHAARGSVDRPMLVTWTLPLLLGVACGTGMASIAEGRVLSALFAACALLVAANMMFRADAAPLAPAFPNGISRTAAGILVGLVSAMMGLGGAAVAVPVLTAFGMDIKRAIGTSAAIGIVIAFPSTLGYMIAGWGVSGLPPFSVGFVNIAAAAIVVPVSMLTTSLGVRVAHAIPPRQLTIGFGAFLILTACRMGWNSLA